MDKANIIYWTIMGLFISFMIITFLYVIISGTINDSNCKRYCEENFENSEPMTNSLNLKTCICRPIPQYQLDYEEWLEENKK